MEIRHVNDKDDIDYIYDKLYMGLIKHHVRLNQDYQKCFEDTIGLVNIVELIKSNYTYVAVNNGELIGIIIGIPNEDCILINALYVIPKYRRLGVATRLMKQFIKDYGEEDLELLVMVENGYLVEFYERFDFEVVDTLLPKKYNISSYVMYRYKQKRVKMYRATVYTSRPFHSENYTIVCSSKEKLLRELNNYKKLYGYYCNISPIDEVDITDPLWIGG